MSHGWSGSTILGNGLGAIDGFVHVGELRTLWADGLIGGGECGCRRPIPEGPFWTRVLGRGLVAETGPGRPRVRVHGPGLGGLQPPVRGGATAPRSGWVDPSLVRGVRPAPAGHAAGHRPGGGNGGAEAPLGG